MSDEVEVLIHDVAFGGNGVGRLPEGKVVFVPGTITGERVRVRLAKSKKKFSDAELVEVLEPSPQRVAAPCVYFGNCGGCQYQHMSYQEQMRVKTKQVVDTLQRIGGFKELPAVHVEGATETYHYRNKITVHTSLRGDLGFFATDQRTVVDIEKCIITTETINTDLAALRKSGSKPRHATIVDSALRADEGGGFQQINRAMAEKLLTWTRGQVGTDGSHLIDLYCGSGFFSIGMSDLFKDVCGLDRDERAIHAATSKAREANHPGMRFFAAAVEDKLEWLLNGVMCEKAIVVVDPTREGLEPAVAKILASKKFKRLVYVSCNPATLARDLRLLIGDEKVPSHYKLASLGVFDMFPQTAHIEAAAVLES